MKSLKTVFRDKKINIKNIMLHEASANYPKSIEFYSPLKFIVTNMWRVCSYVLIIFFLCSFAFAFAFAGRPACFLQEVASGQNAHTPKKLSEFNLFIVIFIQLLHGFINVLCTYFSLKSGQIL